jgi:hypothetical protein
LADIPLADHAVLGLASASGRVLRRGDPVSASLGYWGSNLNPGHFIHRDERPSSPVCEGSEVVLRSGITLRPEVLPLSNLAGYLPPFWLSPQLAMRRR